MNETLEVIKRRRSIRNYRPDQITDSELEAILEAAISAPSAMNQQKWHFTVIQNQDVLKRITDLAKEVMKSGPEPMAKRAAEPDFSPFFHAPTVIVVTGDSAGRFVQIDCSLAAQNIVLAAESLDIGSCIMTSPEIIFKSQEGRELMKELGVPEGYAHVCTVALGYKDGDSPPAKPRRKDVIDYIR
ncbi:MAG TPA: nitroreductase family protein [Bacillota bacterium]|jgi:nitroreductase|nr:nitroreductase family protein [Bacillota bacterium]HQD81364.1 nitroreductase family protein [Bacillota bacterium]